VARLLYLNWDRERDEHGPATDLFHNLHHSAEKTVEELDQKAIDELYRDLDIEVEAEDPEKIWTEWNRGSGQESQEFLEHRYCQRCESYIEGSEEAVTHASQNHGYDTFQETGEPHYISGERSMSVGDIAVINNQYHVAMPIGFQELEDVGENR